MYKELTRRERTLLNSFFSSWNLFDYFRDKNLLVREAQGSKEVYMLTDQAGKLALDKEPFMAGMPVCDLRKHVEPGIEILQIFAGQNRRRIMVDERAEALFLYGRDIFGRSIVQHTNDFGENEVVIVTNGRGDAIGIGRTRFPAGNIRKNTVTVTNVADLGLYLREEGTMKREDTDSY